MRRFIVAASAVLVGVASAQAADLPSRKAPPPVYTSPVPAFNWTGFYVGANIGYGWMDAFNKGGVLGAGLADPHGGIVGGGQIGYNYQFSPMFVAGLETDFQGTGIGGGFVARRTPWLGTVRARLGVTPFSAPVMLYATGGFAYGRLNIGPFPTGVTFGKVATGWTVGGGAEYAFSPNWSVKAEYLYTDIGANFPTGPFATGATEKAHDHLLRVGLNYRFGWGAPAAVVARY